MLSRLIRLIRLCRLWLAIGWLSLLLASAHGAQTGEGAPVESAPPAEPAAPEETAAQERGLKAPNPAEPGLDVEQILTEPAPLESYADAPRCISTSRIRGVEILDNKTFAFRTSRTQYYLVQLKHRCPMLQRNSTLVYETSGLRLCALDRVRAMSGLGGASGMGPACQIPGFQEITREQLLLLREELKQERRGRGKLIDDEPQPESPEAATAPADEEGPDPAAGR